MANSVYIAPKQTTTRPLARGFSLVEVTLALGVMAFAFAAVFSLIPTGLSTFQRAMEASVGSQISQRVISEAQQTDFEVLTDEKEMPNPPLGFSFRAPEVKNGSFRYFSREGNEVFPGGSELSADEKSQVAYWVNTKITPGTDGWRHLATVTVQVAKNPGNRSLEIVSGADDPGANLVKPTTGVAVSTYSAIVSRNK